MHLRPWKAAAKLKVKSDQMVTGRDVLNAVDMADTDAVGILETGTNEISARDELRRIESWTDDVHADEQNVSR